MIKIFCDYKKHSFYLPYLLIALCVLSIYTTSFSGDFILDDIPLVKNNEYFREWHSIGSYLFKEDGFNEYSGKHTGYYRPLVPLSYTIDYKIWGMSAPGFRLTNLILHLLTCCVLYSFFNQFINKKNISLMLVLIFALHPVNTETVSWVASRNNILATIFGILSLLFYIQSCKYGKYYKYLLSIVFFLFAVFSKEFGLMLLPIFFLYQRLFNNNKEKIYIEVREYLPFLLIALIYLFLRQNVTGAVITPLGSSDFISKIYNAPYVFFLNLKLIFLPVKLHSFITKYPHGFFNASTIISIIGFFTLIVCMWIFRKKHLFIFSLGAFFVAIFPVLGILKTSAPSIIAMRWLYFPLPFILLLPAIPLIKLYEFNHRLTFLFFIPVIFYLGFNSYTLNRFLWHSEEDFFKQEVLQFKNYFYADGLADIYKSEKKPDLALKLFEKNIQSGVKREINYFACADILLEKGFPEKALQYLEDAKAFCYSHKNLGLLYNKKSIAYLKLNNLEEARRNILKAIIYSPEEPVYWENKGVILGREGDHTGAVEAFKKAIRIGIDSTSIHRNLINGYLENSECGEAFKLINRLNRGKGDALLNKFLERAEKCMAEKTGENAEQ